MRPARSFNAHSQTLVLTCFVHSPSLLALESSHAIWGGIELAKTMGKDEDVVICLSGRGDKDVEEVYRVLPKWAEKLDWVI